MLRLAAPALLIAISLLAAPAAVAASAEIQADSRGHFLTRVRIGHTDVDVIIDTGASFVVLSYEDAEQAGLKPRMLISMSRFSPQTDRSGRRASCSIASRSAM